MKTTAVNRWDEFARANPHRYICTDVTADNTEAFWQAGQKTIENELLPLVREWKVQNSLALELGCGVGRLLLPISRHFQQAVGVDVSPEMVRRATQNAVERGAANARFLAAPEPAWILQSHPELLGHVDFLYSLLVFQHIEDFRIIESYAEVIHLLLAERGMAYLQFDTRNRDLFYRMRNVLPDSLLPWFWRRSIRRIRRNPAALEQCFRRAGLRVVREVAPRTDFHRYVLTRSTSPAN